ncbi:binding-protein-dependent transport systems inner membrane component [Shewanella denitrificans OS217]|uniref:Binding-protein-dependent transport systems inner membrane component n=1 Tax=Shewanella denitrificans (strain OS217 / ATCC BAA-1090 / DSM 15013) TaxID=318161 RepID=Q12L13_SHEDO|nr:ABC transporter permease subunit [Shewanella denitrificans]ABE55863.1 binding-protein-dependent transport systems inner membrane component [Shewanella denitrificans OS217]
MESQVSQPASAASKILGGSKAKSRAFKDKAAQVGVTIGGTLVFVALLLIFFYLLYVIKPIFDGADIRPLSKISLIDTQTPSLMIGTDEQNEIAFRVLMDGQVEFYSVASGQLLSSQIPLLSEGETVTSSAKSSPNEQRFALGLSSGKVLVVDVDFAVTYPDNQRLITPRLRYPNGETPLNLSTNSAVYNLAFDYSDSRMSFAYQDKDGQWRFNRQEGEENMMTEEVEWSSTESIIADAPANKTHALVTPDHSQLILPGTDKIFVYNTRDADAIDLLQVIDVRNGQDTVSQVSLLAGASSILVSYHSGLVAQYFQVNSDSGRLYQRIRQFDELAPMSAIATEFYRKSFAVVSKEGELSLLYTTSERKLFEQKMALQSPSNMAFSPRSNALIIETNQVLSLFAVDNSHPEVSWSAMWEKVWYEGYPEPKYVWQSTSGSDDFEAKLSLMPLAFGTMKAAFYAMLFAVPLAVAGAIYTAYFMSPKVRSIVKPTIEIMEALPTVILGFLAGLWLAPLIEDHLPGIFMLLVLLPSAILASAFSWSLLPGRWKQRLPEVYQELMLIPVIIFVGWFCFAISPTVELALFGGDTRQFITNELGITFDQRNALVVGIAMGFAVIPTIFSIAEDAIFSVPRHLSNGSLALGATNWQTLTRVVLLTASPGIFSAIMMGLGRAVGETMIVLMATGNTAILEWSVFEGMRTLAANIAVEMPESAIGSSHYRVLFLAAFVLFIFTFFFNTIAEVVRQRLRERYSSL